MPCPWVAVTGVLLLGLILSVLYRRWNALKGQAERIVRLEYQEEYERLERLYKRDILKRDYIIVKLKRAGGKSPDVPIIYP